MRGLSVPIEWKNVLGKVQAFFPNAIIAGGALRDLYHGKPIKDVDIFVPVIGDPDTDSYFQNLLHIDPYLEILGASLYGQSGNTATPGFRNIHAIYQMQIDFTIYEVIFIEDRGEDLISVFDLSIAQIGYDGHSVRTTTNFENTILDKVIRVCNQNRVDRQVKRLRRVLEKYPEYQPEEPLPAYITVAEPFA